MPRNLSIDRLNNITVTMYLNLLHYIKEINVENKHGKRINIRFTSFYFSLYGVQYNL